MSYPEALVGRPVGGSYICKDWELRVTKRCLDEDLGGRPQGSFESIKDLQIIKTFVKDRKDRIHDRSQVAPLTCGCDVWVLARGNDHRAATWYDDEEQVVWLLAYGHHRSGQSGDFFPYCKGLDADDRLLPSKGDYRALFLERDRRFVEAVRLEVPLILKEARNKPGEHRRLLGGDFRACISVEVDEDIGGEAITVAIRADTTHWGRVEVVLATFHPQAEDWSFTDRLPSRKLMPEEVGFTCTREIPSG